jgi:hypothetical protein
MKPTVTQTHQTARAKKRPHNRQPQSKLLRPKRPPSQQPRKPLRRTRALIQPRKVRVMTRKRTQKVMRNLQTLILREKKENSNPRRSDERHFLDF